MKKFLSILVATIFLLQLIVIQTFANDLIVEKTLMSMETNTVTEEKVYCTATLDDDFADDCVLIVIDHANSIVDRIFTKVDFPGVDVKEITYLTLPITPLFEESETNEEAQKKAETLALTNVEEFNHIIQIDLNVSGKDKVLEAIKILESFDFVLSAEPNYIGCLDVPVVENEDVISKNENSVVTATSVTEETYYNSYAIEKMQLENAWNITTGSKQIKVGVIDTGISSHSDLNANLTLGYDFFNNHTDVTDENGHGTHVAGIIGAINDNGVGVNKNVVLVPMKIFYSIKHWKYSELIEAIEYARNNNIPIVNCSIGIYLYNSDCEMEIKNYNGLVICSAGNDDYNVDVLKHYPSGFDSDNVISVAATDESDNLAVFNSEDASNFGEETVDLAAPGFNIYSTHNNGKYAYKSGTSMATPYVTGVAALILSVRPDLSAEQVKACILNGVDKVNALQGKCVTSGRLNAYKALQLALNFPKDQMVSGDFDGNGKDDVAYITDSGYGSMKIYVRENGVGTPTLWTEETAFYTANVDDRVTAGDFNGDGKDDIALLYDNKNGKARIHVLLSNGDGFNSRSSWFVQSVEGMYNANRTTGRVTSGDFNGDGLDDVSAMYDNGDGKMRIHMFISTGNSFNWEYWYEDMAGGNFYANGVTGRYEAGDFNGDGKDDIAAMYGYADGRTRVHVWLSNGTSLNQRTAWFIQDTPYYYNTERVKNRFVTGDFNDDGKDDICTLYEYSSGTMMLHVFVSQGNTFSWWQNWYHSSATGSFYTNAVTGFNSGDYNGDGKMDIMLRYSYQAGYSKLLQYQSNGSSFNYIAKFLY